MKVDSDPFEVNSNFVEPCCFEINMVGFHSFEFDTSLGNFEQNICQVSPGVGEGLLDFLMQQKLKDRDVSLCPRCNAVFDAEAAALFEKGRMKKELAHKEEQVRQQNGPRRVDVAGSTSSNPTLLLCNGCKSFRGRGGRGRGRFHGRFGQNRKRGCFHPFGSRFNNLSNKGSSEIIDKGAKTSALDQVVFPNKEKGKEVEAENKTSTEPMLKDQDDDLYDDEFVEEDEMISVVSILPAEFANSSHECLDGDYYDPN
ncbi:hypothetical protein PIB30_090638 [Stylosanthes scabra]|uniref:Uncharacterized protein n=1 Tax=Stylosanthes scabra TaxID=79078 RepID=A0ABU6WW94_9FABA|nr:hypothetical protein [Stylosanthes scabra]